MRQKLLRFITLLVPLPSVLTVSGYNRLSNMEAQATRRHMPRLRATTFEPRPIAARNAAPIPKRKPPRTKPVATKEPTISAIKKPPITDGRFQFQ